MIYNPTASNPADLDGRHRVSAECRSSKVNRAHGTDRAYEMHLQLTTARVHGDFLADQHAARNYFMLTQYRRGKKVRALSRLCVYKLRNLRNQHPVHEIIFGITDRALALSQKRKSYRILKYEYFEKKKILNVKNKSPESEIKI